MIDLYLQRQIIVDTFLHHIDPISVPAITMCIHSHIRNTTAMDESCSYHSAFLDQVIPFEETVDLVRLNTVMVKNETKMAAAETLKYFATHFVRTYKTACFACFHLEYNKYNGHVKMTNFDRALSQIQQVLFVVRLVSTFTDMYIVLSVEDQLLPLLESRLVEFSSASGLYSYRWRKITLLPPPFATNCFDHLKWGFSSTRQCATRCMNISTVDKVVEKYGANDAGIKMENPWDKNITERFVYCRDICSRPNCVIEDYKMVKMFKQRSYETSVIITYPLDDDFVAIYKEKLTFIEFTGLIGTVFGLWLGLSVSSLYRLTVRNNAYHRQA
ncbi:hypothetical protein HDE_01912 [Halotydeus destructor]|nr:hypothetical protein HDE_01912 [Halotydeus destructor]